MKTNKMFLIFVVALIVTATAYPANALVLNNHRPSVSAVNTHHWTAGSYYTPLSNSYVTGTLFTSHAYWRGNKGESEFSGFYQNSRSSNWNYDNNECELETTATPEPASLILFGVGLVGAGVYRRIKK